MQIDDRENTRELMPTDLRGILKYVPLWRNHTFVLALDGSVVESDSFTNLMLELAVLRNLGIRLVVVFGIGAQLARLGAERGISITDARGYGPTDRATLDLAVEASGRVQHAVMQGLTQMGLQVAAPNAVRSTERGVLKGVDQLCAGKVDRIDTEFLHHLMAKEIVPVVGPISFNRDGQPLRLNSDLLASRIAIELRASKLMFLLPHAGLSIRGKFCLNIPVDAVRQLLENEPEAIDEEVRSKAQYAVETIEAGVPRAHLIDCRIHDGVLTEVFSKVGIGSMIHSNPYAQIRRAKRKDAGPIRILTKGGVRDESLRARTREEIEAAIEQYYVYDIDESIIACFRLTPLPETDFLELGSVFVQGAYQGRSIGKTLVEYAVTEATRLEKRRLYALSTQAAPFFKKVCGFTEGTEDDLPPSLAETLRKSGRNSRIYYRDLGGKSSSSS
jgi:amino-acid N-acetyltransferase